MEKLLKPELPMNCFAALGCSVRVRADFWSSAAPAASWILGRAQSTTLPLLPQVRIHTHILHPLCRSFVPCKCWLCQKTLATRGKDKIKKLLSENKRFYLFIYLFNQYFFMNESRIVTFKIWFIHILSIFFWVKTRGNPLSFSFLSLLSDVNAVSLPASVPQCRNLLCLLDPLCCQQSGLHKPRNCRAQKNPAQKNLVAKVFLKSCRGSFELFTSSLSLNKKEKPTLKHREGKHIPFYFNKALCVVTSFSSGVWTFYES